MTVWGLQSENAVHTAREWVTADRVRVFGVAAVAGLVLTGVCLVVPHWFFSVVLAAICAVFTAGLALLAAATWWASREGAVDSRSLWDQAAADDDEPEDLFRGFQGFREDPPQQA